MRLILKKQARKDISYWKKIDKKILRRIENLIENIQETPFDGLGKPEPLRKNYSGYWSRRINSEHRLVYKVEDNEIIILQCRFHYEKN